MSDEQLVKVAEFLKKLEDTTAKNIANRGNKDVQAHEKKYHVKVYAPGEEVFVNIGHLTNRFKKRKNFVHAVVVEGNPGGFYTVEWKEGKNKGKRTEVEHLRLKPFHRTKVILDKEIADEVRERSTKQAGGTKRPTKANNKPYQPQEAKTSTTVTTKRQDIICNEDQKRSESHWFKNEKNLLSLDRGSRKRKKKIIEWATSDEIETQM